MEWISKVDSKASFALAIESAALLFVADASRDGALSEVSGAGGASLYWLGVAALIAGVIFAVAVVTPRMRSTLSVDEIREKHIIHFGHVRHWTADELTAALNDTELLPVISDQIVILAKIAWDKHVRVEWSLGLGLLGGAFVALAAFA
ncbi:Pycsar system effector family protein [Ornithinimicrobium panacihumi]|uniref:Pycsar system effector family protein n=1 Tax=Ornithinimicrobium panacihumi TaxID=2008449 RepID=UPI003F8AFDD4